MSKLGLGSFSDIVALLRTRVNRKVLADFGQFGLDIIGIFDPTGAADAANAVISIVRGDWFGAITSAISILPGGDIAKVGKFLKNGPKYVRALSEIAAVALKNPKLAFSLAEPFRQIRSVLHRVRKLAAEHEALKPLKPLLDELAAPIGKLLDGIKDAERFGLRSAAKSRGGLGKLPAHVAGKRYSVNEVLELLGSTIKSGKSLKKAGAEEFLGHLALSKKWRVMDLHRSPADKMQHLRIDIDGFKEAFHLRLNKSGVLVDITHGKAGRSLMK